MPLDLGATHVETIEEVSEYDETTSDEGGDLDDNFDQPWVFWKWLIPVYVSLLCVSVMLTISYWVTEATSAQFLIYIGSNNDLMFDLLPTLPTVYLLVEFAFNMVPIDWPMLVFVYMLFTLYMVLNFIAVSASDKKINVYDAFDWYCHTGLAFVSLIACYVLLALIFAMFLVITQRWKLPSFIEKTEERFTGIQSVLEPGEERSYSNRRSGSMRRKGNSNI